MNSHAKTGDKADTTDGRLEVFDLHGEQDPTEQSRAMSYGRKWYGRVKVILATNIAESSLTIDAVRVVVDFGLVKRNYKTPLLTSWTAKQNIVQRQGRARRTAPGE